MSPSAVRIAVIIALAHCINDAYASIVPPLLPRIMDDLGISIAMAATLGAAFSIATALPQPFFGYLGDRFGRRTLAVGGMLVSAVFVSVIGFAPSYWALLGLLLVGGLGGAAFHPPGASYAVRLTAGKGAGARYSIFSFGGAAGYSVGPLVAVALVGWGGMERLWVAMLPAIVLAPFFFFGLPSGRAEARNAAPAPPPGRRVPHGPDGPSHAPVPAVRAGASGAPACGVAGTLERSRARGHRGGGFLGMSTLIPIVVMAQEMIPRAPGASSGIVMGLAWTVGSVGVMGTGVADMAGPQAAALLSMPVAGVAALLALHPGLKWMPTGDGR